MTAFSHINEQISCFCGVAIGKVVHTLQYEHVYQQVGNNQGCADLKFLPYANIQLLYHLNLCTQYQFQSKFQICHTLKLSLK